MAIKLRVISDHYQELGEHRSRVFGVNGGTIGRAPDNDWILPDPSASCQGTTATSSIAAAPTG